MNKIRISLGGNEIELEGTDEFIDKHLKGFYDRIGGVSAPRAIVETKETPESLTPTKKHKKKRPKIAKKSTKRRLSHSIVKDLNLVPKGKKSFSDFAKEKAPSSNAEKCLICVYYLQHELNVQASADGVHTCFKTMKWILPSNLDNALQWAARQKGWLDTSNMKDIKIATPGENYVEHSLPKRKESK
jgi:hypothetical protein